jgi:hypothetical protein
MPSNSNASARFGKHQCPGFLWSSKCTAWPYCNTRERLNGQAHPGVSVHSALQQQQRKGFEFLQEFGLSSDKPRKRNPPETYPGHGRIDTRSRTLHGKNVNHKATFGLRQNSLQRLIKVGAYHIKPLIACPDQTCHAAGLCSASPSYVTVLVDPSA